MAFFTTVAEYKVKGPEFPGFLFGVQGQKCWLGFGLPFEQ